MMIEGPFKLYKIAFVMEPRRTLFRHLYLIFLKVCILLPGSTTYHSSHHRSEHGSHDNLLSTLPPSVAASSYATAVSIYSQKARRPLSATTGTANALSHKRTGLCGTYYCG